MGIDATSSTGSARPNGAAAMPAPGAGAVAGAVEVDDDWSEEDLETLRGSVRSLSSLTQTVATLATERRKGGPSLKSSQLASALLILNEGKGVQRTGEMLAALKPKLEQVGVASVGQAAVPPRFLT
jgi:hypothetical protein|eukprot:COSAG01_NODE_3030_length_6698_cov_13.145022_9_plen_126_part_00